MNWIVIRQVNNCDCYDTVADIQEDPPDLDGEDVVVAAFHVDRIEKREDITEDITTAQLMAELGRRIS